MVDLLFKVAYMRLHMQLFVRFIAIIRDFVCG